MDLAGSSAGTFVGSSVLSFKPADWRMADSKALTLARTGEPAEPRAARFGEAAGREEAETARASSRTRGLAEGRVDMEAEFTTCFDLLHTQLLRF